MAGGSIPNTANRQSTSVGLERLATVPIFRAASRAGSLGIAVPICSIQPPRNAIP
jgi:hypothetical protein